MDDPPNELTLVTSSPAIAYEMQAEPVHVVVAPGELDQHMKMLAGRWTVEFLSQLNFDVAFVSCAGITLEEGLTTSRRPLADVINAARAGAEAHGGADRRDQVRARVAAHDHGRRRARPDHHRPRASNRGRRERLRRRGRPPRDPVHEGGSMSRPVTLFTGQWADLTLEELAEKCGGWGFDGLELACWGDHFDVAQAVSRLRLLRRPPRDPRAPRAVGAGRSATTSSARRSATRSTTRHKAILPPDVWGDGDPEGVRQRAADYMKDTARAAAPARRARS